ncbi:hypothetical protein [Aquidulcibacter paucihalophilus]|uniref:hypothetical protein n=1 Tax=Aquidulcibacter paucihalophilus TaxID=1978549 RepID=UPI0012FF5DCF|nr:hypothetical protein [Aquidulcibacter paucihalophilus]
MAKSPLTRVSRSLVVLSLMWLGACAAASSQTELSASTPSWRAICQAAEPDILPNSPILTTSIQFADGRGSGNEVTEAMRTGFGQASFQTTSEALAEGAALPAQDSRRWNLVPLSGQAGPVTFVLAPVGTPACNGFEREIAAQRTTQSTGDPMRFYTDRRLPPAPPGGRNWCVASLIGADPEAVVYRRKVDLMAVPRAHVTRIVETLEQANDNPGEPARILARRTFLQKVALDKKGFETGMGKDCAGKASAPQPALVGVNGIALRPLNPPNLVTAPTAKAG